MSGASERFQNLAEDTNQIRLLLHWSKENEELYEWLLNGDVKAIFNWLAEANYVVSEYTERNLPKLLARNSLEMLYERFLKNVSPRSTEDLLAVPPPEMAMSMEASDESSETPPQRIVSTGFADEAQAETPFAKETPLTPDTSYYFWFEVGERVAGSIEAKDVELPTDKLPPEARLDVVLFGFDGEVAITRGADVGEIRITSTGHVVVSQRVAEPASAAALLDRRLFFPVKTAVKRGRQRLRCNIYYQQTLVQSRLVTAYVGETTAKPALVSHVDYTLSKTLDSKQLVGLGQNRLSMMLNSNGDGTHGFRFFGEGSVKNDASLSENALQNLIDTARGVMRRAAWGDKEPYKPGNVYRYTGGYDEARLQADLISFALRGRRFYDAIIDQLVDDSWALEDMMIRPGQVQLANKESAGAVVPIAMFYDYPLDDGARISAFTLCESFTTAVKSDHPLSETACFQGNCPSREAERVVCPSGFWGYRHQIGLPLTLDDHSRNEAASDIPTTIPVPDKLTLAVNVSTDPAFTARPKHEERLKEMGFEWQYADDRDESFDLLKKTEAQVVYFYCHGGLTSEKLPYISLGAKTSDRFTRASLRNKRIRWRKVRPLVFINGCHTVALEPEAAIDLASGFVVTSQAAGVIGTEITIFEPIAVTFAEAFMRFFLKEKRTAGEAVRQARLKMLKDGNPLGLVYIPYVVPGLKVA